MGPVSQALAALSGLPTLFLVVLLVGGALLENVVPPVPADTFVVVGGLLVAQGRLPGVWIGAGIWLANVAGALVVYGVGWRHGPAFFAEGLGRALLRPRQVRRISRFYERFGVWAIFVARFLPGLRAVVPAFAGVSGLGFWRVAPPVLVASGLWYGFLLWLGIQAGLNLGAVEQSLAGANRGLVIAALVIAGLVLVWWLFTRWGGDDDDEPGSTEPPGG